MADFVMISAERALKSTRDEYEALRAVLDAAEEDDEIYCGLELEYDGREVYLVAPFAGNWEALPQTFLTLLGALIAKNGLEYLEFGVAMSYIRPKENSYGGTYFRVRTDGSIWEPELTW